MTELKDLLEVRKIFEKIKNEKTNIDEMNLKDSQKLIKIQKECNHEIGIILRERHVSDYDMSVYRCLNCGESFIGEKVNKLKIFPMLIDYSYEDGNSFNQKYLITSKLYTLKKRYNENYNDEQIIQSINKFYKNRFNESKSKLTKKKKYTA